MPMGGDSLTPAPPPDDLWAPPPSSAASSQQLAEWWPRAGAAAIDLVVRIGIVVACAALGALAYLAGPDAGAIGLAVGVAIGYLLALFVYAPLLLARWDGQTVGHRVTSTRIVMADGSRMPGGRAFVREALVKNILIEGVGLFTFYILPIVNYLMPLWDDGNEALHDKMCKTRVVVA